MKRSILHTIAAVTVSLSTGLTCFGQAAVLPVANNAASRAVAPTPAPEAAERAEDAALLQELEADGQPNKSGPRHKGSFPSAAARGGGGGIGLAPMAEPGVSYRVNQLTRPGGASRALIVRSSDTDPKTQAALEEDLAVMSHLLNKSLEDLPGGGGHGNKVMGIDVFFTPGAAPLRSLYLDNYGAVFFLSVNFPLLAPTEKHIEEKPAGDTAWEEARQELYGQHLTGGPTGELNEEYSQEKVDKLKQTLFDTLKNAANIRGLKPDEFVTLWVCGGSSRGGGRFRVIKNNPASALGGNVFGADQVFPGAKPTILTIRVRKSVIDDYAKGKVSPDDFQKRAQLAAYVGDPPAGDGLLIGGYNGRARF